MGGMLARCRDKSIRLVVGSDGAGGRWVGLRGWRYGLARCCSSPASGLPWLLFGPVEDRPGLARMAARACAGGERRRPGNDPAVPWGASNRLQR